MRKAAVVLLMAVAIGLVFSQPALAACQRTWDGEGDGATWRIATNWSGDVVPTATEDACIPDLPGTPTITIDSPASVGSIVAAETVRVHSTLTLTDAVDLSTMRVLELRSQLDGVGNLDVTERLLVSGGGMDGTGVTRVTSTAQLLIDAGGNLGRTLRLEGAGTWLNGQYTFTDGGRFENAGTLDLLSPNSFSRSGSNPNVGLINTGTLRRTTGAAASSQIAVPLQNNGTIDVGAGELRLDGGSTDAGSTGAFGVPLQAGRLTIGSGTYRLAAGATLRGDVYVQGANLQVLGLVTQTGSLELQGTLSGAGELRVAGTMNWTAGLMADSGTTRVLAGGLLLMSTSPNSGNSTLTIGQSRRLLLEGETRWSAHQVRMDDFARIENSGVLDMRAESGWFRGQSSADAPLIVNTGTITRTTGADTTTPVSVAIDNDGIIESRAGTLAIYGSPDTVSTGRYGTDATGGLVRLEGTTARLGAGARFDGRVSATGPVRLDGLTLVDGEFELRSELSGVGDLEVRDRLNWFSGGMNGTGTTHVITGGRLMLSDSTSTRDIERNLLLEGDTIWWVGQVRVADGVTIDNRGRFDAAAPNSTITRLSSGANAPQLLNTGTVTRSQGVDASTFIDVPLRNNGVIESPAGTLVLNGGSTDAPSAGRFGTAGNSGLVDFTSRVYRLGDGARMDGRVRLATTVVHSGVVRSDGALTFIGTLDGPGRFEVAGTLDWRGGDMQGTGVTRMLPTSATTICCTTAQISRPTLRLEGALSWVGGAILLGDGTVVENVGTFDAVDPSSGMSRSASGALVPRFVNLGTITRTLGSDTITRINVPLENDGIVELSAGELEINGPFTQSVDAILRFLAKGTVARDDYGVLDVRGQARLAGQLQLRATHAASVGENFGVISYQSRRGQFATVSGTVPGGLVPQVVYATATASITLGANPGGRAESADRTDPADDVVSDVAAATVAAPAGSAAPARKALPAASSSDAAPTVEAAPRVVLLPADQRLTVAARRLLGRDLKRGTRLKLVSRVAGVKLAKSARAIQVGPMKSGSRKRLRVRVVSAGRAVGVAKIVELRAKSAAR